MPTGVIINSLSIVLGGIFGALLGHKLSHRLKTEITLIFGICAMAMGINAIGLMENMPAVIFSIIIELLWDYHCTLVIGSIRSNFNASNCQNI